MRDMITEKLKMDFPLLQKNVNGKQLVYLNSAATSQKPKIVIDTVRRFYEEYNSNIHRGNDFMSAEATKQYDLAREKIARFINANTEEIIFTKGATEGINLIANSYFYKLKEGDEIILSVMEHHSNIVPWQQLQGEGIKLRFIDIDDKGKLKIDDLKKLINAKTKLIAITYVSNVLGTINSVKEICEIAHNSKNDDVKILVDAAQAVPHLLVDVKKINCDFLVFSGHKMLGPMGIGVLYGRKELLSEIKPLLYGGDMIKEVNLEKSDFAESPRRFEAGTQNVEAVIGLSVAIDYLDNIGLEKIMEHEQELINYAIEKLKKIKGIKIYGPKERSGIVSFNLADLHSHDAAEFLGSKGIAVRAGHMCCQPLMKKLGISSCVRASFYLYNIKEDVDMLCNALEECRRFFKC